jgi:hypothetical protein
VGEVVVPERAPGLCLGRVEEDGSRSLYWWGDRFGRLVPAGEGLWIGHHHDLDGGEASDWITRRLPDAYLALQSRWARLHQVPLEAPRRR